MSGFADFAEMVQLIIDYGHNKRLQEQCENVFIPLASLRIGRDLQSKHNESVAIIPSADPLPLPTDFGAIRSLRYQGANGPNALRSRDASAINLYAKTGGGRPAYYSLNAAGIETRPVVSGNFELLYWNTPVLSATDPTNPVLAAHPMLYLYAGLIELHVWTQDREQRQNALDTYTTEYKLINRAEARSRADKPQAIGE